MLASVVETVERSGTQRCCYERVVGQAGLILVSLWPRCWQLARFEAALRAKAACPAPQLKDSYYKRLPPSAAAGCPHTSENISAERRFSIRS